jgi:thiamine-phosphate pyrophosphorylase
MRFSLPKVYPITDRRLSGLSHAEQVSRLISGGANFIQLREKYLSPREFYEEAEAALKLAHERGAKIIINDRVDIALILKADGVHLGQEDLPPEAARKLLGDAAIIGYSTHNIEQAMEAIRMPVDYIAIGPIFNTTSKDKPDPVVTLEGLKEISHRIKDRPLVAIGGITYESAKTVIDAGATSVALISAVIKDPKSITSNLKQFLSILS